MKYIVVFLFAVVAFVLLAPVLFVGTLTFRIFTDGSGNYLYKVAYSIDQLGNAVGGEFWQTLLVNRFAPYHFGEPDDTISYALARNEGYWSGAGKVLVWVLEFVDPGHMKKSLKS
jgi:hypothetical protein